LSHEELFALSNNVRTFTEQNIPGDIRTQIRESINASRIVVFLGFGFHQQNMSLLQTTAAATPVRRAFATIWRLPHENSDHLKRWVGQTVGCAALSQVQLLDQLAFRLLENTKLSLMAPL